MRAARPVRKDPWRILGPVLLVGLALAVLQHLVLVRRPPRLLELEQAAASSGPAALKLRFSRPMDRLSVEDGSGLGPPLAFRIQGESNPLLLLPEAGQRITGPLALRLAGQDRRGLALPQGLWHWDPRPHLVAVVPVATGEQLQLRQPDGRWLPLSPVWTAIPEIEPLGDGSGVALVSRDADGMHHVWRVELNRRHLGRSAQALGQVRRERLERFAVPPLVFAHLSTNRSGDLLVQGGSRSPQADTLVIWRRDGSRRQLDLEASGPVSLLPQGGAAIVPERDGLSLRSLPPREPLRQILPGSRDLSSFCPVAGRALLLRHWPDFRRSLELVEPGQAPRALWIGEEGLVASACSRGGERIWALLIDGIGQPRLTLLTLDRRGQVLQRRPLEGWELEPGTGLHYDPTGDRLLLALRPLPPSGSGTTVRPEARPALIDAESLELTLLERPVRQVRWLKAG